MRAEAGSISEFPHPNPLPEGRGDKASVKNQTCRKVNKTMSYDPNLIVERQGSSGIVTLNRPEALNALTLGMIEGIRRILADFRNDPAVESIVFQGAGDKAFCAGGDVKAVYQAGVHEADLEKKLALAKTYFAAEYKMNRELFHFPKPLIAIMNGITMGGGFGVAGPCRVRIATEKTVFAMPEVGIGLFPDVGSMYFLTRVPGRVGHWLALTGERLSGEEMVAVGLATEYAISSTVIPAHVFNGAGTHGVCVSSMDPGLRRDDEEVGDVIEICFAANTVEGILENLDRHQSTFAQKTAATMRTKSPTSLVLTDTYYRWADGKDFDAVTGMDYRLAMACMQGHEFYEGIRAALIDRDKTPRWSPTTLAAVDGSLIENWMVDERWVL